MGETAMVEIVVNGEPRAVRRGSTVASLMEELALDAERVAVELDRRIVRRGEWDRAELAEGARLEIVVFVGGG